MFAVTKSNMMLMSVRPITVVRDISLSCSRRKGDSEEIVHPEGHEPMIPPYVEREGEEMTLKRARLLYQSRKRGMLENGLLLSTFAKRYLDGFDETQIKLYDRLINLPSNDWDLFYWACGKKETPPEFDNEIMDLLKEHIQNKNKEARLMQPDL